MTDIGRVAVYRRGSFPGQVDHPGWLSKVVEGSEALETALAEGWSREMKDAPVREAPFAESRWKRKSKMDE